MTRMASLPNTRRGRELYERLGAPRKIVAPMVDQSELAWRELCRAYGAELCYSPMYHARLFGSTETYREQHLAAADGRGSDRPLVIQFCANKPAELVAAVRLVEGRCDAVDLNLGCPQGIARKGHYGAFLMEDWDLVAELISAVHAQVPAVPITAKIRVFEDRDKTLAYARRVLEAGAVWLTVHGRTRDMKGQHTGLADWSQIRYLREHLPEETVLIANGNIIYRRNFAECLAATGADAVMTAETCLANPAIFGRGDEFPRVDTVLRTYFDIARRCPGPASHTAMKTHMFKLLRTFFIHETDIRNKLGPTRTGDFERFESIVQDVEARVAELLAANADTVAESETRGYMTVPHWRTQPLFRVVNGVASNGEVRKVKATAAATEKTASEKTASEKNATIEAAPAQTEAAPATAQTATAQTESAQTESAQTESAQTDSAQKESAQTESAQAESAQAPGKKEARLASDARDAAPQPKRPRPDRRPSVVGSA